MKRFRWDKKYLYWGVTAFCVVAASIVFYMLLNHLTGLRNALGRLISILSPFVWGLVIAYLLYPLMKIYQRDLFLPLARRMYKNSRKADTAAPKLARGLSVLLSVITLLVVVVGIFWLVVPQLYSSLEKLVTNSSDYVATADAWITKLLADYPQLDKAVSGMVGDMSEGLVKWVTEQLLPQIEGIITSVTVNLYYMLRGIYNIIIGIVVSVYVLYNRESFGIHCKRILYCIFSLEAAEKILAATKFVNRVFMGFISGKILDSLIIGVLCYIGCSILRTPYTVLVSVIVALTNIIPFFGPLIGAAICAVLIVMVDPLAALLFCVFALLLQQFDGNFLGPKILGSKVGMNGFWVLFAIIVGAGLFGFMGMLLGVPVFMVIFAFFRRLIRKKLARSGLPTDPEGFRDLDHFDPQTGEPVPVEAVPKRPAPGARRPRWKKKPGAAPSSTPGKKQKSKPVPPEDAPAGAHTTYGPDDGHGGAS